MSSFYYNISITLLVLWIGGWLYLYFRKDAKKYFKLNTKEAIVKNKFSIISAVLLFSFPFVWINFVSDEGVRNYKKIKSEFVESYSEGRILGFYDYALQAYPNNEYVHIDYIQYYNKWRLVSGLGRLGVEYQEQLRLNPESDWYKELQSIGYSITGLEEFKDGEFLEVNDTTTSLYQYAKGLEEDRLGNYYTAEFHYLEALKDSEMRDFAYPRLEYMWYHNFTYEETKDRAYSWNVFKAMSFGQKKAIYIDDGAWGWYILNALDRDFLSADLLGYIAVILSVLVWGLFIFKMLFIHKDKLYLIFSLFVLGSLLPILVYAFSDLLRFLYLDLGIKWDKYDFWYDFINIGMVEELVKFLPWFGIYLIYRKRFTKPVHFMLMPIVSAIGFAFSENLIYVNSEDYEIIFTRSSICIAIHMSCSAIIGYSLYRGLNQKSRLGKSLYVLGGFLLASLIHGLYDYFIFTHKSMLTILVFLIGLHLFILFVNNALNFSNIRDNKATRKLRDAGLLLTVGLVLVFCCQYMVIGIEFGSHGANNMLKANLLFAGIALVYLVSMFRKIRIRPNVLYQFSVKDVFGQFFTLKDGTSYDVITHDGMQFKLFAPKTNLFVGSQMPVIATVEKHIEIQNDANWVLVQFDKPITVGSCYPHKAVMKCKNTDQELYMDKVEVILLFIPDIDAFEYRTEHHSGDFKYVGRVYSRPVV